MGAIKPGLNTGKYLAHNNSDHGKDGTDGDVIRHVLFAIQVRETPERETNRLSQDCH